MPRRREKEKAPPLARKASGAANSKTISTFATGSRLAHGEGFDAEGDGLTARIGWSSFGSTFSDFA
jgi:hypothetical protein